MRASASVRMRSCELEQWAFGERVLARVGWMGFWREVGGREKQNIKHKDVAVLSLLEQCPFWTEAPAPSVFFHPFNGGGAP